MDRASYNAWRLGLLILLLTLLTGAGLALALAGGLADPPRAANIAYQTDSLDGLAQVGALGAVALYMLPQLPAAPFTLEVEASNGSSAGASWGVWVRADGADRALLVDNRGYMLTTLFASEPEWRAFMHIQAPRSRLYVHVENGRAAFRINQELVTTIPVEQVEGVGLALYGHPRLTWHSITLRTDVNAS